MSAVEELDEETKPSHWAKTLLEKLAFLGVILILGMLLLPFVTPRSWKRVPFRQDQLREIARAIQEYETVYRRLPPAYTVDASGNKLHSWRTAILPYLDESRLYDSIDFSKSWDAPENAAVKAADVPAFRTPDIELPQGHTIYHVIVDPRGLFTGRRPSIAKSDPSALLVVQAGKDQSVHWMQPDEYTVEDFLKIAEANASGPDGRTIVARLNGSVVNVRAQDMTKEQVLGLPPAVDHTVAEAK